MSAMIFKLRGEPDQRIDLSGLVPGRLSRMSESEIAALPVNTGRAKLTVGDTFRITMGEASEIRIVGGSARLDGVGAGLTGGSIITEDRKSVV